MDGAGGGGDAGGGVDGSVDENVFRFKVAAFFTVIVVSLVGGFLPLRINMGNDQTRKGFIDHMRFLTAGVFLGVGLLHMLPDAVEGYQALDWTPPSAFNIVTYAWRDHLRHSHGNHPLLTSGNPAAADDCDPFPIPYLLCALGFILVWYAEQRFSSSAAPSPSPQEIQKMMAVAAGAESLGGGSICYVQVQPVASYGPVQCPSPTRMHGAASASSSSPLGPSGLSSSFAAGYAAGSVSPYASPSPSRFVLPPPASPAAAPDALGPVSSHAPSHAPSHVHSHLPSHVSASPQLGLREALLLGREMEMERERGREREGEKQKGEGMCGAVLGGRGHRGECGNQGHGDGHGHEHGHSHGHGHGHGHGEGSEHDSQDEHMHMHAHEHGPHDHEHAHDHEHDEEDGLLAHAHSHAHSHTHDHTHARASKPEHGPQHPQVHVLHEEPGDCCHSQGHGERVCHHTDQQQLGQGREKQKRKSHGHDQDVHAADHRHKQGSSSSSSSHGHPQGPHARPAHHHVHEWQDEVGVRWRGVQGGTEDDACAGLHRHTHATHHHHIVLPSRGGLSYLLTALLSLHSFVVGAALGTSGTLQGTVGLIIALIAHKWAEAFAVGVQFVRESVPVPKMAAILLLYCAMTPTGIVVGMLANSLAGPRAMLVAVVTQAFGAGTVLYIAMLELVEKHSGAQGSSILDLLLLLAGVGIMAAVAAFV